MGTVCKTYGEVAMPPLIASGLGQLFQLLAHRFVHFETDDIKTRKPGVVYKFTIVNYWISNTTYCQANQAISKVYFRCKMEHENHGAKLFATCSWKPTGFGHVVIENPCERAHTETQKQPLVESLSSELPLHVLWRSANIVMSMKCVFLYASKISVLHLYIPGEKTNDK